MHWPGQLLGYAWLGWLALAGLAVGGCWAGLGLAWLALPGLAVGCCWAGLGWASLAGLARLAWLGCLGLAWLAWAGPWEASLEKPRSFLIYLILTILKN